MRNKGKKKANWVVYLLALLAALYAGRKGRKNKREVLYKFSVCPAEQNDAEAISAYIRQQAEEKGWGLVAVNDYGDYPENGSATLVFLLLFVSETQVAALQDAVGKQWHPASVGYVKEEKDYRKIVKM